MMQSDINTAKELCQSLLRPSPNTLRKQKQKAGFDVCKAVEEIANNYKVFRRHIIPLNIAINIAKNQIVHKIYYMEFRKTLNLKFLCFSDLKTKNKRYKITDK